MQGNQIEFLLCSQAMSCITDQKIIQCWRCDAKFFGSLLGITSDICSLQYAGVVTVTPAIAITFRNGIILSFNPKAVILYTVRAKVLSVLPCRFQNVLKI